MLLQLRFCLVLLALAATVSTTSVWGAEVAISPVRIHLSGDNQSELIELTNNGTEPARFQISAHTWHQSDGGEMILKPTRDLVYFPSIFDIAVGKSRRIRVASVLSRGPSERAYRLIIEELPQQTGARGMVRVLTRLNIPVFVQTKTAEAKPALATGLKLGRLSVVLENRGSAYFKAATVRVVGRSKNGRVVLEQSLPAWYVLVGGRRIYTLTIPPETCSELDTVVAVARTEEGSVRSTLNVAPSGACSG
jgi:fimbrial chaperone protein